MLDFAQKLIDEEVVTDVEGLEKLAGLAALRAQAGRPRTTRSLPPTSRWSPCAPRREEGGAGPGRPSSRSDRRQVDDAQVARGLRELLGSSVRFGASDLHLCTGQAPVRPQGPGPLLHRRARAQRRGRAPPEHRAPDAAQKKAFLESNDLDYALAIVEPERYRVNLMFHKDGAAGSYRMVPEEIKSMTELGFEEHLDTLKRLLSYHNGLVLITGPVGSGKTTTLASMVAYLNETRKDHIITVEDPIEVVQKAKGCNVTQRQVGDAHEVLLHGAQGRPARGSRHHRDRRAARPGDDRDGGQRRARPATS